MNEIRLPQPAESALSSLQDTKLTPMEEVLFKAWTKANGIQKPDSPTDSNDYRGIYKETNGTIVPGGQLKQTADKVNSANLLQRILAERMQDAIKQESQSQVNIHKQGQSDANKTGTDSFK